MRNSVAYCLFKKSWPILCCKLLYKMGRDFMDKQQLSLPILFLSLNVSIDLYIFYKISSLCDSIAQNLFQLLFIFRFTKSLCDPDNTKVNETELQGIVSTNLYIFYIRKRHFYIFLIRSL